MPPPLPPKIRMRSNEESMLLKDGIISSDPQTGPQERFRSSKRYSKAHKSVPPSPKRSNHAVQSSVDEAHLSIIQKKW